MRRALLADWSRGARSDIKGAGQERIVVPLPSLLDAKKKQNLLHSHTSAARRPGTPEPCRGAPSGKIKSLMSLLFHTRLGVRAQRDTIGGDFDSFGILSELSGVTCVEQTSTDLKPEPRSGLSFVSFLV